VRKFTAILFLAFFVSGCMAAEPDRIKGYGASTGEIPECPQQCVRKPFLGIEGMETDSGLQVNKVFESSAAQVSGIKVGYIIKSIDNTQVKNITDLRKITCGKAIGSEIVLAVIRNNADAKIKAKLGWQDIRKDKYAVLEILDGGGKVSLAVIPGEINNALVRQPEKQKEWSSSTKEVMLARIEGDYLELFGQEKNFSIVDRQKVDKTISELKMDASGMISDENQNKIGEMLGATHILIYGSTLTPQKMVITMRLLEVQTGKVLASIMSNMPIPEGKKMGNKKQRE
jgi:PBP1b-binding outer membrane lipoprotein LpoB